MAIFSVVFDPVRGYMGRARCWVRLLRALAVGTGAVVLGPGPGFCRSGGLSCFVFVVFVFFSVCLSPLVSSFSAFLSLPLPVWCFLGPRLMDGGGVWWQLLPWLADGDD